MNFFKRCYFSVSQFYTGFNKILSTKITSMHKQKKKKRKEPKDLNKHFIKDDMQTVNRHNVFNFISN